jgi:flagellar basal-body rod protein FlgF
MDNSIYVGLSRQMTLQRQLDVAANNLANMDTAGFKVEHLAIVTDPLAAPGASFGLGREPIKYVLDQGATRDFGQGALEQTGATFDVAIEGQGFFSVQTANGVRYTRDGRFTTDASNQIVDGSGEPVLSTSGAPITVDPTLGTPMIGRDGSVSQATKAGGVSKIGRIGVTRFANKGALSKVGANQFSDDTGQAGATPAPDAVVQQGYVEKSNVNPVTEVTSLIDIQRAYERMQNIIMGTQDLSAKAVDGLGKLNS